MKNGFSVFLASFLALGLSWSGFVLGSAKQLGTQKQAAVLNSTDVYPIQRSGAAALGLQVYRANGCAACHTEQVRQVDVTCEVVLTSAGKKPTVVSNLLSTLKLAGLTREEADAASDKISAAGGSVETHIVPVGVEIPRWGLRQSVAADYLYDAPVQLGSLRAGPDLANVAARFPDLNWQLVHLYAPQAVVKNSAMPPFRFLFEVRKIKPGDAPSPDALKFPQGFAPAAGSEVVPTTQAKELAAYLLSLKADAPLYEAPFTAVTTKP